MSEILTPERLKQATQRRLARPPEDRWADLVERGIIDERGRVLKRAEASEIKAKAKRKAKTRA